MKLIQNWFEFNESKKSPKKKEDKEEKEECKCKCKCHDKEDDKEEKEEGKKGLTAGQKKLPEALQKAILKKQK